MAEREPNSRRFWRVNSLIALRMAYRCLSEAQDLEDYAAIQASHAELAALEARERAVRARAERRFRSQTPTPTNN